MKVGEVFAPHGIFVVGLLIWCSLGSKVLAIPSHEALRWLCLALSYTVLFVGLVCVLPLDRCLVARPTPGWEAMAAEAEIVLILGFGCEVDAQGELQAGAANHDLLTWTLAHTTAETLLVQEGVWAAACSPHERTCEVAGRTLRRMHEHDSDVYLNTLDTALCALQAIPLSKTPRHVLLAAHAWQLRRAVWDFERVRQSQPAWREIQWVVPEIDVTTWVPQSMHWQTRHPCLWRLGELFVARPRDWLSRIPATCKAPVSQ